MRAGRGGRGGGVQAPLLPVSSLSRISWAARRVLRGLAVEAGLDGDEAAEVLAGDAYAAEVRADERRAGEIGVHAVPHFVVNRRSTVSGAVPVDERVRVMRAELPSEDAAGHSAG